MFKKMKIPIQVFSAFEADVMPLLCVDSLNQQYSYTLYVQVIPMVKLRTVCTFHPAAYLHETHMDLNNYLSSVLQTGHCIQNEKMGGYRQTDPT